MAPNPKIVLVSGIRSEGEVVNVGALNPLHIRVTNQGSTGDVFLNISCTSESTAPNEPSYPKGIRLANWKPLGAGESADYEAMRALTDAYDPTGYGLCGGCHPDGDCWPDPEGATQFIVETGERYSDGSLRLTHRITGPVFYVGTAAPPEEPPPNGEEPLMSRLILWTQDQDGNPIAGGKIRIFLGTTYIQDVTGTPDNPALVDLEPGTYILHPWPVSGYEAYDVVVTLPEGVHLERYVVYTLEQAPDYGTLNVNTSPVSGDIFLDGQPIGQGSASIDLAPGNYVVSFGVVDGYETPSNAPISIGAGAVINLTGTYEEIDIIFKAYLTIRTTPVAGEIIIGNQSAGYGSVDLMLNEGTYQISYGLVEGYITPKSVSVTLGPGEHKIVTGTYVSTEGGGEGGLSWWWLIAIPVGAVAAAKLIKKKRR